MILPYFHFTLFFPYIRAFFTIYMGLYFGSHYPSLLSGPCHRLDWITFYLKLSFSLFIFHIGFYFIFNHSQSVSPFYLIDQTEFYVLLSFLYISFSFSIILFTLSIPSSKPLVSFFFPCCFLTSYKGIFN